MMSVPSSELTRRMARFRDRMNCDCPELGRLRESPVKVNLYYFTGTIQDGLLTIPRDRDARLLDTPQF